MIVQNSVCTVSIVIPVYNTAEYLQECLDSVIAQTFDDFEVILVDDGSTDGSLDIEREYSARDPRFRVIEQSHQKQGAARNLGLEKALGEYIYFMDSDDVIEPELLEKCYLECNANDLDFVMFDTIGFSEEGIDPSAFDDIYIRASIIQDASIEDGRAFWIKYFNKHGILFAPISYFLKRGFLADNGIRFVEGVFYEDNEWAVSLFLHGRRIKYLPRVLYKRRYRAGSVMTKPADIEAIEDLIVVYERIVRMLDSQTDDKSRRIVSDTVKVISGNILKALEPGWGAVEAETVVSMFSKAVVFHIHDSNTPLFSILYDLTLLEEIASREGGAEWKSMQCNGAILKEALKRRFPFAEKERIGLYGSGKIGRMLIDTWKAVCGEPASAVSIIDSFMCTGDTRLGYPVVNVNDIEGKMFDAFVIGVLWGRDDMAFEIRKHAENAVIFV